MRHNVYAIVLVLALLAAGPVRAAVCFPDAQAAYLQLNAVEDAGKQATLQAYAYSIDSGDPAGRQALPVKKGLLIVDWGGYPGRTCYMVTGDDGRASTTFTRTDGKYPDGGASFTYTVTFCPFSANHASADAPNPQWMANCARLKDTTLPKEQGTIVRLDYAKLARCPGTTGDPYSDIVNGEEVDLGDTYQPATNYVTVRNPAPSSQNIAFCWGLAAVFGLLFAGLFAAGRNPLYFFDLGTGRNVRMNRSAGQYMMMNQNVSIAPVSILKAADSAGGLADAASADEEGEAAGDVEEATGEEGKAKSANDSAQSRCDMMEKNADKVLNDPKAAPEDKKAAQEQKSAAAGMRKAAQDTKNKASARVQAAEAKLEAAKNLKNAKLAGDKGKIAAAQARYDRAKADYAARTKEAGATVKNTQTVRMEQRGMQGYAGGKMGSWVSAGMDYIDPAKWLGMQQGSVLSGMVNQAVRSTAKHTAIAAATRGSVKGGLGKVFASGLKEGVKESAKQVANDWAGRGIGELMNAMRGDQSPDAQSTGAENEKDLANANQKKKERVENLLKNNPGMTPEEAGRRISIVQTPRVFDSDAGTYVGGEMGVVDLQDSGNSTWFKKESAVRLERQEQTADKLKNELAQTYKNNPLLLQALDPSLVSVDANTGAVAAKPLPPDFEKRFQVMPSPNGTSQVIYVQPPHGPETPANVVLLGGVQSSSGSPDAAYVTTGGGVVVITPQADGTVKVPDLGALSPDQVIPANNIAIPEKDQGRVTSPSSHLEVKVPVMTSTILTPGGLFASSNPALDFAAFSLGTIEPAKYGTMSDDEKLNNATAAPRAENPMMGTPAQPLNINGQDLIVQGNTVWRQADAQGTLEQVGTLSRGKITLDKDVGSGSNLLPSGTYNIGSAITREGAKEQTTTLESGTLSAQNNATLFASRQDVTISSTGPATSEIREGGQVKALIRHDGQGRITKITDAGGKTDIDAFHLNDGTKVEVNKSWESKEGEPPGPDKLEIKLTNEVAGDLTALRNYKNGRDVYDQALMPANNALYRLIDQGIEQVWATQPPRLGAMDGNAWNVLGLSMADYLANTSKYAQAQGIEFGRDPQSAMSEIMQREQMLRQQQRQ